MKSSTRPTKSTPPSARPPRIALRIRPRLGTRKEGPKLHPPTTNPRHLQVNAIRHRHQRRPDRGRPNHHRTQIRRIPLRSPQKATPHVPQISRQTPGPPHQLQRRPDQKRHSPHSQQPPRIGFLCDLCAPSASLREPPDGPNPEGAANIKIPSVTRVLLSVFNNLTLQP